MVIQVYKGYIKGITCHRQTYHDKVDPGIAAGDEGEECLRIGREPNVVLHEVPEKEEGRRKKDEGRRTKDEG